MLHWYNIALRHTRRSTHNKHKMAAVVIQGGRVLAIAANRQFGHAEQRALRRNLYPGATIVIARANRRVSMPCSACAAAIRAAGIECVVYIDHAGSLIRDQRSTKKAGSKGQ